MAVIDIAFDEGVLILTLNRPEKKNALSDEMYRVLAEALEEAEKDPATRVVMLKGAGGNISAGNDLSDFAAIAAGAEKATKRLMRDADAIAKVMTREGEVFAERLRTAEAAEAFQAFAQRRAPDFTKAT